MDLASDLLSRTQDSLAAHLPWLAAAVALVLLSGLSWRLPEGIRRRAARPMLALLVALSLAYAWHLRWIADDAFISFRYARHLVAGQGLTWNPGERVEGFTNPLWTLLSAAGIALGAHPVHVSLLLTLGSLALTLVLVARLSRRLSPDSGPAFLPLSVLLLAGNYVIACYGTSGLETMAGALCVLLALDRALAGAAFLAGLAGIAATLLHPDHALFYVALGVALLLDPDRRRRLPAYALPFVLLYLPSVALRWWYYGDLVPNTFHAKSGGLPYYDQGLRYLLISGTLSGLLFALPAALRGLLLPGAALARRFILLSLALYLPYICRIGGDFMLGRLLVVVAPLVLLLVDRGLRFDLSADGAPQRWRRAARSIGGMALALPTALMLVPNSVIGQYEKYWGVADERNFYTLTQLDPPQIYSPHTHHAEILDHYFIQRGLRPKVGIGSIGITGYLTDLPIIDLYGLTSPDIAANVLRKRGRPGHEKLASPAQVFAHDVQITDTPVYPPTYRRISGVMLDGMPFYFTHHDPVLVDALAGRQGVEHDDFGSYLIWWSQQEAPKAGIPCGLWFSWEYYFSSVDDPALRQRALDLVTDHAPELEALRPFLITGPDDVPEGWRSTSLFTFDAADGWSSKGFDQPLAPRTGPVAGERHVAHSDGAWLDTNTDALGPEATGRARSPDFTIDGDVMTLRVGGGRHNYNLVTRLVVNGKRVRQATGCNSNLLSRQAWDVAAFRGQQAHLEIVDKATDPWGYSVVDDVRFWEREGP